MILTTHALVGAALGKYIPNLWILTIIAIPLHYFLDTFRHGEYLNRKSTFQNTWWRVALDLIAGLIMVALYAIFFHPTTIVLKNILLGSFISMFPDLLTVLYWKLNFKFLKKLFDFHAWVHPYPKEDKRYDWTLRNARNDIVFSLIALLLLIFIN